MSRSPSRLVLGAACAAAVSLSFASGQDAPLPTRERLERHVRHLSSDELRGRKAGTEEALVAAGYLADELRASGIEPAGDDGTFLQAVPVTVLRYDDAPRLGWAGEDGTEVEAVYGVDVDGIDGVLPAGTLRVVVVRSADDVPPEPDPRVALFVDAGARERREWLEGSAGWGLIVRRGSSRPGREPRARAPRDQLVRHGEVPAPSLSARGDLRAAFEGGAVRSLRVESTGRAVALPAANVVGRLPGTGALADEVIVFSAHYDHIGTVDEHGADEAEDTDTVYNGADDDASGCAAVLELAHAFGRSSAAGEPPARTLIFLLVTGEEIGLVGTEYYLEHPAEPLEHTVCNLNFEMVGRPDDLSGGPGRLWLTGFERTNLGEAFRAAGLSVMPDARPEQHFFERSDNYAFAQKGIVAQTLSSYDLHQDYHRVSDEADTLDYAHMETAIRAAYRGSRALADGSIRPRWQPGGDPSIGR